MLPQALVFLVQSQTAVSTMPGSDVQSTISQFKVPLAGSVFTLQRL